MRTAMRFIGRAAFAALLAAAAAPAWADAVIEWNRVATEVTDTAFLLDPISESRVLAITQVAVHDALNAIEPRYEPYRSGLEPAPDASSAAAVAVAAHDALAALVPSGRDRFDEALRTSLDAIAEGNPKRKGIELGHRAAERILSARRSDGAETRSAYRPGSARGAYRPTPPDFTPAFQTHWGRVTPFVLRSSDQFRPEPPPAVESDRARSDVEEVRRVGAQEGSVRTTEQSEIARYWYESSTQGWNRIARELSASHGLDAWENARLLALVNLAMADGFIAGFEAKYHYNFWRPVTAIRDEGASSWLSYLGTPPVPDYPSTHTVLGAAAASAMARFFGTDMVPFSMTSGVPYAGITRRFWSLSEAARENGASRILAGIHFPTAVRAGYGQGEQVGAWVFDHALRPLNGTTVAASR